MDGFEATCGVRVGGGGGSFEPTGDRACRLEVNRFGLLTIMDTQTQLWNNWYFMALFKNDHRPRLQDVLLDYQQANFSGYVGPQRLTRFTPSEMRGVRAVTEAAKLTWKHNGGPVSNAIYGYYVTDNDGNLVWAERFCSGPIMMDRKGRAINITQVFWVKNWLEETSL